MQKYIVLIENNSVFSAFQEINATSPNHAISIFSENMDKIAKSENNVVARIRTEENDFEFLYDICDLPENCQILAFTILNNMYIVASLQ